jgi:hypothetical protein
MFKDAVKMQKTCHFYWSGDKHRLESVCLALDDI